MKLYDLENSPFATRVRIQIRHKNLPIDITHPPVALRTPEFYQAFVLGKVPILILEDGSIISESTVIMDYLEDLFPSPALVPGEPLAKAHNGMLIRYTDNHLSTGLTPLFKELVAPSADQKTIAAGLAALAVQLDKLARLLTTQPDFKQRDLQTGDICLATNLYFAIDLATRFGESDLFKTRPVVADWWNWVRKIDALGHEIKIMDKAHCNFVRKLNT